MTASGEYNRRRVLKFLSSYYDAHRRPPTIVEIGTALQMVQGHVTYYLAVLVHEGHARKIGPSDRPTARCYVALDWP